MSIVGSVMGVMEARAHADSAAQLPPFVMMLLPSLLVSLVITSILAIGIGFIVPMKKVNEGVEKGIKAKGFVLRLDVAKSLLQNMVNGLKNDRVGLVVFAGETMVQSPLSYDKNSFLTFLQRVNPALLSEQGTNLGGAIQTSIDRFSTTASQTKVILLISDGEDPDSEHVKSAINEAAKKNIQVFTVGIGSERGGYIPEGQTWFGEIIYKRHADGRPVISSIAEGPLKEIAEKTKAEYFRAKDIATYKKVIKGLNNIKRVAVSGGKIVMREELYWIPLLIAFLLLLVEWVISERIPYSREQDHWLKRI